MLDMIPVRCAGMAVKIRERLYVACLMLQVSKYAADKALLDRVSRVGEACKGKRLYNILTSMLGCY